MQVIIRHAANVAAMGILILGASGCGEFFAPQRGMSKPAGQTALTDTSFVMSSLEAFNQRQVDEGQAGARRVTHPQVRAYVKHVADDHAVLLTEAAEFRVPGREGVPPPSAEGERSAQAAWLSASGPAADVAYLDHSVREHEEMLSLLDQNEPERDSPLKRYIVRTRVMIETHRAIMLDLQKMLFMTRYFSADALPASGTTPPAAKPGTNGTHPPK